MSARFDPQRHHRRSIRMRGYDYSRPGAYFVTIMAHGRARLFGRVVDGVMLPSAAGQIVRRAWLDLPTHYPHVHLDAFVIMPDHVHGIMILTYRIADVDITTDRGGTTGAAVWQRNYYERIIRDTWALACIRRYIAQNPACWTGRPRRSRREPSR